MSSALGGVRVKINRAKKHLAELEAAIRAHEALHPYSVMIDRATEPGYELHRFWINVPVPQEWGAAVGDVAHNLRSALDHLAHALVINDGGSTSRKTAFPIGSSLAAYTTMRDGYLRGAKADTLKLLDGLKPYSGGNDSLDRLHRLDIADKHRLLIPVAAAHKMFGVAFDVRGPGADHLPRPVMTRARAVDRKFPLKHGDILGSYRRGADPEYEDNTEFEFAFEIAFGEGQIFDGEPVVPTLHQLVDFIERLVDIFARRVFGVASW